MKVIDILKSYGRPFPSLEFVPPLKGSDINVLYQSLEPLMEFNPPFVNITSHREEVVFTQTSDGSMAKRVISKRPGTVAIAAAVMKRFPIEVVPHILCAGMTKYEIENQLIDLSFLDIQNVMALRGDGTGKHKEFIPKEGGYYHTNNLVEQIRNLNEGRYLDENLENPIPTNFCIGVAGYPEKHFEAADMESDILNLKKKVDAGAEYIITQMFFDNNYFYKFVENCRKAGITVPIIPGLKPISTIAHLEKLPQAFSLKIPFELKKEMLKAKGNRDIFQLGIEWCAAQSKDLLANGAPAIHYYTMGKAKNIKEILKRVF
ncbi:MAG: methylenetetrahydrofolate reductase [Bacteroidales bacterium]|nr:methylenetetrahydrofolate reductase [Bacteroidales bacterium]